MSKVILEGVDHYRVTDAMFESARVVLNYLGEPYSPAYLQGVSGAAFRIGGICPCAPTCTSAMSTSDLLKLLGYEVEELHLYVKDSGVDANAYAERMLPQMISRVKAAIRAGRPVLVWNAFTNCEWDVVAGFDEAERTFYGRGSYAGLENEYAIAGETRPIEDAEGCGALGAILVGEKTGMFDARSAELAALREAVSHARTRKDAELENSNEWFFLEGIQCYERWASDFESPERKRTMGDAYCLGVYRSTHRAAADFVHGLAPKYPVATVYLEQAAAHFAAEAHALDACMPLLWWRAPEGPDPERNAKVLPLLQQAKDAYAYGIYEIETALTLLDR